LKLEIETFDYKIDFKTEVYFLFLRKKTEVYYTTHFYINILNINNFIFNTFAVISFTKLIHSKSILIIGQQSSTRNKNKKGRQ